MNIIFYNHPDLDTFLYKHTIQLMISSNLYGAIKTLVGCRSGPSRFLCNTKCRVIHRSASTFLFPLRAVQPRPGSRPTPIRMRLQTLATSPSAIAPIGSCSIAPASIPMGVGLSLGWSSDGSIRLLLWLLPRRGHVRARSAYVVPVAILLSLARPSLLLSILFSL